MKTQCCDIDPKVVETARKALSDYGIGEFFYGITTKMNQPSTHQFKKLRKRLPQEMVKARYMVYSSEAIREYRHQYLNHFAPADSAYFEKQVLGFNLLPGPDTTTAKGQQQRRLMADYGLHSWGTYRVPVKYHPDWHGVFVFFSSQSHETLRQALAQDREALGHCLMLYASLFNDLCITQINPITNFRCLSDRAMQVLQMTSEGYSSEEISESLSLSARGVNYHLDRLKELFNARNRAQLISQAHILGLLD